MEYYQVKKANTDPLCASLLLGIIAVAFLILIVQIIALIALVVFIILAIVGIIMMAVKWKDEKKRKTGIRLLIAGAVGITVDLILYAIFIFVIGISA